MCKDPTNTDYESKYATINKETAASTIVMLAFLWGIIGLGWHLSIICASFQRPATFTPLFRKAFCWHLAHDHERTFVTYQGLSKDRLASSENSSLRINIPE